MRKVYEKPYIEMVDFTLKNLVMNVDLEGGGAYVSGTIDTDDSDII